MSPALFLLFFSGALSLLPSSRPCQSCSGISICSPFTCDPSQNSSQFVALDCSSCSSFPIFLAANDSVFVQRINYTDRTVFFSSLSQLDLPQLDLPSFFSFQNCYENGSVYNWTDTGSSPTFSALASINPPPSTNTSPNTYSTPNPVSSDPPPAESSTYNAPAPGGSNKTALIIGLAVGLPVLLAILVVLLLLLHRKHTNKNPAPKKSKSLSDAESSIGGATQWNYKDLQKATGGFSESRLLGIGGFGTVYEGRLKGGRTVAVKRLNHYNHQVVRQFVSEITLLSRAKHPNLVELLGYCLEEGDFLVVYEFVANGTLEEHLHGDQVKKLTWHNRLQVAYEVAEALEYLHFKVKPPIFHRDVKSSNILLDENFHAKLADFGLSRDCNMSKSHISTAPQGTPGYLDPVYHQNYQLTDKSDVFSFGVVLMEIVTGKPAVDMSRSRGEINLSSLAVSKIQSGMLEELIDPEIEKEGVKDMVKKVAELGFRCLAEEREDRPSMVEIVQELRQIIDTGYWVPDDYVKGHQSWLSSTSVELLLPE